MVPDCCHSAAPTDSDDYKHPPVISKSAIVTGNLQCDCKNIKSTTSVTGSTPFTLFDKQDKTHVFSIGVDVESLDRADGWDNFSFSLLRGVEGFFNGMRTRDTTWPTRKGCPAKTRSLSTFPRSSETGPMTRRLAAAVGTVRGAAKGGANSSWQLDCRGFGT